MIKRVQTRLVVSMFALVIFTSGADAVAKTRYETGWDLDFWNSHDVVLAKIQQVSAIDRDQRTLLLHCSIEKSGGGCMHSARFAKITLRAGVPAAGSYSFDDFARLTNGDKVLLVIENTSNGAELENNGGTKYNMMPNLAPIYLIQKPSDPKVLDSLRLCDALTKNAPAARLEALQHLQEGALDQHCLGRLRVYYEAQMNSSSDGVERSRIVKLIREWDQKWEKLGGTPLHLLKRGF